MNADRRPPTYIRLNVPPADYQLPLALGALLTIGLFSFPPHLDLTNLHDLIGLVSLCALLVFLGFLIVKMWQAHRAELTGPCSDENYRLFADYLNVYPEHLPRVREALSPDGQLLYPAAVTLAKELNDLQRTLHSGKRCFAQTLEAALEAKAVADPQAQG